MSYGDSDWIRAISRLVELTSKQEITWEIFEDVDGDVFHTIERAYISKFEDRHYVIYSSRYRNYVDIDEWHWAGRMGFDVYKYENLSYKRIASAPDLSVTATLYSVVEDSYAFNQEALKGLI